MLIDALGATVAARFRYDGRDGYLYRDDRHGLACRVTAAERRHHVRRHGWIMAIGVPLILAAMVGLIGVATWIIPERYFDRLGPLPPLLFGAAAVLAIRLLDRLAARAPARAFAGRLPVA